MLVKHLKMAIGVHYLYVIGKQTQKFWTGQSGIITKICKSWHLKQSKHRRFVKNILTNVHHCFNIRQPYLGHSGQKLGGSGRQCIIKEGSVEEQIIANWMEQGLGFRQTTLMVNQHRREEGMRLVGRSAVQHHFDKMHPAINRISKTCQGNTNNHAWEQARKRQCEQLLIMFGRLSTAELLREHTTFPLLLFYEASLLPHLTPDQIVWFDETHVEQEGGTASRTGVQIRFPRDPTGKYSPLLNTATYALLRKKPTFKFAQEARFLLGVAIVKDDNGEYIGKKAKLFDYTGKKVDSIKAWTNLEHSEMQRVKNLENSGIGSPWVKDNRLKNNDFWDNDDLS